MVLPDQLNLKNWIIYGKRRKHFDREALEKGLSLYEITLILHSDKVTIEQMSPEWKEQNSNDYDNYVWPLIKNIKKSILDLTDGQEKIEELIYCLWNLKQKLVRYGYIAIFKMIKTGISMN